MTERSRLARSRQGRTACEFTRRQWLSIATAAPLLFGQRLTPAVRKLKPSDEADRDPELQRLLQTLKTIVEKRDEGQLLSLLGQRFRVEFSAGKGRNSFRKFWQTDRPDSEVWSVLSRLLSIGGTFYAPTLFAIPYVYTQFPIDLDPFSHVVALQSNVEMHREPRPDSSVVALVAFEIVPTEPPLLPPARLDRAEWVRVTAAAQPGYVASRHVWSPVGHRMFFEKRRERWEWISLACAD